MSVLVPQPPRPCRQLAVQSTTTPWPGSVAQVSSLALYNPSLPPLPTLQATCSTIHYDAQARVHRLYDDGSLHQLQSMHGLAVEGWRKVEVQGQAQQALMVGALVVSLRSVPASEQGQSLAQRHAQGQGLGQGLGSGQGQGLVQGQGQAQDQVQATATSSHLRKHPLPGRGVQAQLEAAQATLAGAGAGTSRTTGTAAATLRAGEEAAQWPGPGAVQLPAGVAGAGAAAVQGSGPGAFQAQISAGIAGFGVGIAQDPGAMQGTQSVQVVTGIVGAGAGVVALAAHGHSQQQQLQQQHAVAQHSQGGPAATATARPALVTAAAVTPAAGEAATAAGEAAAVVAAGEAGLEAEPYDDLNSLLLLPDLLSVWDPAAIACAATAIHPAASFPVHGDIATGAGLWHAEEKDKR